MRGLAILLLVVGLGFIGYSGYQIWDTKQEQQAALEEVDRIIAQAPKEFTFDEEGKEVQFEAGIGDKIGKLLIPKIDANLPIVEGVDEKELKQGVGHYGGTSFPMQPGQIVLSGHRDTVFRRMAEIELGDELIVQMPYGEVTYIIEETEIVSADDLTVIRPEDYDEEVLTLTTCYPFRFIGDAPDRFIVYAKPKL